MEWRAFLCASVLLLAACANGGDESGRAAVSVADSATSIIGAWKWTNEVGSITYRFETDGSVRITTQNRFQTMNFGGSWSAADEGIVVRTDGDDTGAEDKTVRFLDADRVSIAGSSGEQTYVRVASRG